MNEPDNRYRRRFYVIAVFFLDVLEHERMVTQFTQLHDGIHQRFGASFTLFTFFRAVRQQDAFTLHMPVQHSLQAAHIALDDVLDLVW